MDEKHEIEHVVRIHNSEATLEVGTDPDTSSFVEIRTPDKRSEDYYGEIRLALPKEAALLLAAAIKRVADSLP